MSIKEALTVEENLLAEKIGDEYIADITVAREPDINVINNWLDVVYGLYDLKRPPRVEIVGSPQEALTLASTLTGEKQQNLDDVGVSDSGWVAFYDVFHQIKVISDDEARDTLALRDFLRVAWDSILLDECAIIVRRPVILKVDDAGNLHCATGPCIEWSDGQRDWAWHGTWVPERFITDPRSHTKAEYLAISNTEQRRALSELAGWSWVAELLGTQQVDSWTDPNTKLNYVLLACGDQRLLSKQSPALKDGSQPRYLEPVHENLKTARAARKWQATRLTPDECEQEPDLAYEIEA